MLPYDRKRAFRKQWLYLGTFLTVIFLTVTNLEMVAEVLQYIADGIKVRPCEADSHVCRYRDSIPSNFT